MATVAGMLIKIGADITDFNKKMMKAESVVKKASQSMTSAGRSLTTNLTVPLMAIGTLAFKASMDFNASMANIATLIPGNIARVEELKASVQDMAIATGQSTKDISEGLYQVVSAFGDTSDTVEKLELNVKAAVAGLSTVTDALNLTSAVTKAYADVTLEATEKVSDLAFMTVKLGQTTFPELAAAIGMVTPLAAELNVVQEELFATFATLTGVTGKANQVSTQTAAILRAMIKPTEAMSAAVKELGYRNAGAMVESLGMVGSLRALMSTTDGTGEAVAALFGRAEALVAVFALASGQADVFDEKLAQMYDSLGATQEAFDEQMTGINEAGATWKQFKQLMIVVAQDIGDAIAPALVGVLKSMGPLIDKVRELIKWFTALDDESKKRAVNMALFAAALGPMILIMGQLGMAVHGVTLAFVGLNAVIAFLMANPIVAIIAGVVLGLGLVTAAIIKAGDKIKEKNEAAIASYKKLQDAIKKTADLMYNEQITAIEATLDHLEKSHETTLAGYEDMNNKAIAHEEELTEFKKSEIDKRLVAAENSYNDTLELIDSEHAEYENFEKNKTEIAIDEYDKRVKAASKSYDSLIELADEQASKEKAVINRSTSLIIGDLEDRIAKIGGAKNKEIRLAKQQRMENRAIELEDLIAAEQDAGTRQALIEEREQAIAGAIASSKKKGRERQKWAIREEILAEKISAEERKAVIDKANEDKQTGYEKGLDRELTALKANLAAQLSVIKVKRQEQALETYNALVAGLVNEKSALDKSLEDYKAMLAGQYSARVTASGESYKAVKAGLELELAALNEAKRKAILIMQSVYDNQGNPLYAGMEMPAQSRFGPELALKSVGWDNFLGKDLLGSGLTASSKDLQDFLTKGEFDPYKIFTPGGSNITGMGSNQGNGGKAFMEIKHTGTITVEGINDKGELVDTGIMDMIAEDISDGAQRYVEIPGIGKVFK